MAMRAPELSALACSASPLVFVGIAVVATPVLAADPESLDEEFLEYLAEFDRDDWSWFDAHRDDPERERNQARKPVTPTPAPSSADKEHQP